MSDFPALTGFYKLLFLYLEPVSTVTPLVMTLVFPGASWFHRQLIPSDPSESPAGPLDPRSKMAVWQLSNCYMLLGLLSSLVFRAVRDALPHNPAAQERILGASLTALAIADASHIVLTLFGLPEEIRYNPSLWNSMTHGNITSVIILFAVRMAWFAGVGRRTYYYGARAAVKQGKKQ